MIVEPVVIEIETLHARFKSDQYDLSPYFEDKTFSRVFQVFPIQ